MRGFRAGAAFRPWLLKIVVNQALTMAKQRQRRLDVTERAARDLEPTGYGIDETVMDRERAALIYRALGTLNERERVVVYLRYFLQLPERELAQYLGCAPGTVKSRVHRALSSLRAVIARDYPQLTKEVI
jgi:RNA polymerase sigma-70 factor (ECF subfamily)